MRAVRTDEELMAAYISGDKSAFRELFQRYTPILQRAMARDLKSAHEEQSRMHVRGHFAARHQPQPPSWRKTHVTQPDDRVFSFSILGTPRMRTTTWIKGEEAFQGLVEPFSIRRTRLLLRMGANGHYKLKTDKQINFKKRRKPNHWGTRPYLKTVRQISRASVASMSCIKVSRSEK